MMQRFYLKYFLLPVCLFVAGVSNAQLRGDSVIQIINAKLLRNQIIDTITYVSLVGDVKLIKGNTIFYCDSAVLNQQQTIAEAFGHVHLNDADSVHTYSDYMKYVSREKKAYLKNNVKLVEKNGVLTTNELEYETQTKIGIYRKGGKIVTGKAVLTSTEATYYGDTRDVYFRKKVLLIDPEYKLTTDTLLYNMETEVARFVAPTVIESKERTVRTSEGYYDRKNKKSIFGKRSTILDKDFELTADNMAFEEASGYGQAQGKAIYRTKDSANRTTVMADDIKFNRIKSSFLATMSPMMIIEQNRDSIFISADTLYSSKLSELRRERQVPLIRDSAYLRAAAESQRKDTSADRFFEAYFNVKIFSDSMQAVGDSLFYSFEDSTFRLFKDPVVWTDNNQLTGDTIYLFTLKRKPERLQVFENALAISHISGDYFNQVKGVTINGYFIEGNINYLRAKGNAESIYYAQDEDSSYIGVNKSTSDIIDMYFESKKPQKVVFRNDLKGTTYPMRQVNHTELKVRGFKWLEARRPKSKFEFLKL